MMRYRLVLLGLNVVLLASVGWTLMQPLPSVNQSHSGQRQPSNASISLPAAATISPSSLDRPLFRPVSASNAASVVDAKTVDPQLRLVGVLLGERRIGFVEQAGTRLRRITEGDEIDGWTVQAIDARALTLARDGRTIIYRLDPSRNG